MRKTAGILALLGLSFIPSNSPTHAASPQGTAAGPSFPCDQAKSNIEKLICSDRELSSLDFEYSRLYNDGLKGKEKREVDNANYNEAIDLKQRDSCAESLPAADPLRSQRIECAASWYYQRIARLSDLSSMSASEWSRRLIGGSATYSRDLYNYKGRASAAIEQEIYFKTPGTERLFRLTAERGQVLWPARIDRSIQFDVYRNVLGSLVVVEEFHSDGNPRMQYFFNKDGRLAAQARYLTTRSADHVYDQYDLILYNSQGREARRIQLAHTDRKISPIRKDPGGLWGTRPTFASFRALFNAKFKAASPLDVDNLGICYVDLSDGYPSAPLVLNFQSQPLAFYKQSFPKMNYRGRDVSLGGNPARGAETLIGTLRGKKVYSVAYPGAPVGIFVEREANQYLPVLYVSPVEPFNILHIISIDGEDVLTYSAPVGRVTNDYDFVLDHGVPRSLNYSALLIEEEKKILPDSQSVRRLEAYDRSTLTFKFSTYTSAAGTGFSGGNLEIILGIKERRAFVKSSHWEKLE